MLTWEEVVMKERNDLLGYLEEYDLKDDPLFQSALSRIDTQLKELAAIPRVFILASGTSNKIEKYLGFGANIIEERSDGCVIEVPTSHAGWLYMRLISGMYEAKIIDSDNESA